MVDGVPDGGVRGLPGRRRGQGTRQRLSSDHAEPDVRLLHPRSQGRCAGAADDGQRGAPVHHLGRSADPDRERTGHGERSMRDVGEIEILEIDPESAPPEIAGQVAGLHPADAALALDRLEAEQIAHVLPMLPAEMAADVLVNLENHSLEDLLEDMPAEVVAALARVLESDDAADVVGALEETRQFDVLSLIDDESRADIETLLRYADESAGGIMSSELVYVNRDARVQDAVDLIRQAADEIDEIHNVYVTDRYKRLRGVLPLRKLVLARPETKVSDIMEPDVVSVSTEMDQEDVAHVFRKYDLVAIPVIDRLGQLVGRITVDDIIDVIHEETEEDISIMAGTSDDEYQEESALRVSRIRLPWLVVGAVGGLGSATVMNLYRLSLEKVLALAFFIPVITAMGGNVGLQTSTIIVRGMHGDPGLPGDARARLVREWRVALTNALVLGAAVYLIVGLWLGDWGLALVVGSALASVILVAATLGTVMPFLLRNMGIDPAVAQGPFVTTLNDVIGILVYLGLATLFIDRLV
ncbi:MAG: magnesium transporter [Candidatus Eisenbacteria bacterium]|nr:magnesium transporter [Candidatus Eisenbacteria bacterium]